MSDPPTNLDLAISLVVGDVESSRAEEMARRLAGDAEFKRLVGLVERVIGLLREGPMPVPPAQVVARVKALIESPAQVGPIAGLVEWLAHKVFDSRDTPAPAGFRGSVDQTHLLFESDAGTLDLQLPGRERGATVGVVRVLGQIETRRRPVDAQFIGPGETVAACAPVDPDGMFSLRVEPGLYDLVIRLEGGAMRVAALRVP